MRFQWTGRHTDGRWAAGEMRADSKDQVVAFLRTQGIRAESLSLSATDPETGPRPLPGRPNARALRGLLVGAFLITALMIFAVPYLSAIFGNRDSYRM